MQEQFRKILKIARKTGDKIIVLDIDDKEPFVVMDLAAYEAMLDSRKNPSKPGQNTHLTENKSRDNIVPADRKKPLKSVLAGRAVDNGFSAEPSEDDLIREEDFMLEPIE